MSSGDVRIREKRLGEADRVEGKDRNSRLSPDFQRHQAHVGETYI